MKGIHRHSTGFSLVEVALAMGLATYCLVAVSGLLTVGITSGQTSNQQTAAANLVKSVVADLHVAPAVAGGAGFIKSPQFGFEIPAPGRGGTVPSIQTVYFSEAASATGAMGSAPVTNGTDGVRYRVTLAFTPPSSSTDKAGTSVRVLVTWPADADQNPQEWPSRYAGALEVVTALDRN